MTVSSSSSKGRHYGRFTPREEVGEVTHWQFGDVTRPEVWQPLARLLIQSGAQAADAQSATEAAHAAGQQRLEGYVAGAGREAAGRLEAATQQLDTSLAALQQRMAQDVLQLACALARQVVRQELQSNPQALLPVVTEALDMLVADGRPGTVRLHPDDHAQVGDALHERFAGKALQWLPDAAVAPGGCLVEAAGAVVDGSLEKRWQRAVAALGLASAGTFDGCTDGA